MCPQVSLLSHHLVVVGPPSSAAQCFSATQCPLPWAQLCPPGTTGSVLQLRRGTGGAKAVKCSGKQQRMPPPLCVCQPVGFHSRFPSAQIVYIGYKKTALPILIHGPPSFPWNLNIYPQSINRVLVAGLWPISKHTSDTEWSANHSSFQTVEPLLVGQAGGAWLLCPWDDYSPGRSFLL